MRESRLAQRPPPAEDDDDVVKNGAETNGQRNGTGWKYKIFNMSKELCFIFAVTFTASAVLNSQTKTKKGPPPVPFFHRGSLVEDFYKGDLVQLMHQVSNTGLAFVMFYAPWDADCQDIRQDFEETAQFYFKQLYFAGVNCWEPGSECRTKFKDVTIFPQLIAYNGPRKAIEYRGPHDADHMIRFVHSLLHPLHRVHTLTDIWRLRFLHDAVVVGHLKFNGMFGGVAYRVLYETALRFAGRDHQRHTTFAVFTNDKINALMNVFNTPSIVLHLWDRKVVYTGEMSVDHLWRWILEHTTKGLAQLNSNMLLPHVKNGAVMVMFTPRHPLARITPYYQMFRRIAMKFNSCGNSSKPAEDDFMAHIMKYEDLYSHYVQEILRADRIQREDCTAMLKPKLEKCTVVSSRLWDNFTCYETKKYCTDNNLKYRDKLRNTFRENGGSKADWRSTEQVMAYMKRENCALLERTPSPLSPGQPRSKPVATATSCQLNTTITFVALDSHRHSHLARALGIDLRRKKHNTAVVLFNREESMQPKSEEVREDSVSQLLTDYVAGETKRFLRSARQKRRQQPVGDSNSVSVIEVDTHTFETVVLNDTQTVVVFYHSPYCSFCRALSPMFLLVAHLLRSLQRLSLVMLDGESNDLPWQYTVHSYPSVIIFPAYRKEESRIFPQWIPVTAHSLSQFILANLEVEERIQGMLALCSKWGNKPELSEEGDNCVRNTRISCLELISETLRCYRSTVLRLKNNRYSNEKKRLRSRLKRLLSRLQYLKSAHLSVARVSDVDKVVAVLQNFQAKYGGGGSERTKM